MPIRDRGATDFAAPSQSTRSLSELGLTPRQGQVLALVMSGKSNKEICRTLGIAERTVKVHLTAVLNALKVTSRTQAVIAANELGLNPSVLLAAGETRGTDSFSHRSSGEW